MLYTLWYPMYKYEHGLSAAEQRTADVRVGEAAARLTDLRLGLGRAFRLRQRGRPARRTPYAPPRSAAAPRRVPSSVR